MGFNEFGCPYPNLNFRVIFGSSDFQKASGSKGPKTLSIVYLDCQAYQAPSPSSFILVSLMEFLKDVAQPIFWSHHFVKATWSFPDFSAQFCLICCFLDFQWDFRLVNSQSWRFIHFFKSSVEPQLIKLLAHLFRVHNQ